MKLKRLVIFIGIIIVLIGIGAGVYIGLRSGAPSKLTVIQKKAGFTIFVPQEDKNNWQLDKTSIAYDNNLGVLTFTMINPDKTNKIVMSQQTTPDPFKDIPNYNALFLSKLNEYKELNVPLGTVALTHPTELKGGQSAVANVRGTLMFLHPSSDLSEADWKTLFSSLSAL